MNSAAPRPPAGELVLVVLLGCGVALLYVWPVVGSGENWGIHDWDQHLFYHAVARESLVRYGEVPLWNPYYCGGTVMLANPQTRALSPFLILELGLGTVRGIKWDVWLHYVIGVVGGYALGRKLKMSRCGAAAAGCLFIFSSAYALHLTEGHTWVLPAALIPWMVYSTMLSLKRPRLALLTGGLLALTLLDGGHYILPIGGLFVLTYALLHVASSKWRRALAAVVLTGVSAVAFSSIKLLPALELLGVYPRVCKAPSGYSVMGLVQMTLNPDQRLETVRDYPAAVTMYEGLIDGVHENGMYIGWIGLSLGLVGLLADGRRYWRLVACLMLALWMCFGTNVPMSLWRWMHALPGLNQMGCAPRFRFVVLLCTALFAGFGLSAIQLWLASLTNRPLAVGVLGALLAALLFADLTRVARPILSSAFVIPPPETVGKGGRSDGAESFRSIDRLSCYDPTGYLGNYDWFEDSGAREVPARATYSALYPALLRNLATVRGYEPIPVRNFAKAYDDSGYRGEVFLWPPVGPARLVEFSPNRFTLEVRPTQDAKLVLNQNYYPGWRYSGDRSGTAVELDGLIAVPVGPQTRRVEVYYRPGSFLIGATVTGLSVLSAATWLVCGVMLRRGGFQGGPRAA